MSVPQAALMLSTGMLLLLPFQAMSQSVDYPRRPIRIIVTSAAGSGIDTVARMVGQYLSEIWKQAVIVDNRVGASGQIGGEIVARSAPDGHTLLMASPVFLISVSVYSKLPYDFARDFTPVVRIGRTPYVMAVYPALNVRTVPAFIALAKSQPGKINYGSNGNGTIMHLAGEMLKSAAGIDIVHVPYKASPAVVTDVISGRIEMMFNSVTLLAPHVQAGRLQALGVAASKPSSLLPGVPTIEEAGLRGFDVQSWYGLVAPTGTPRSVVARLHSEVSETTNGAAMRPRLVALGTDPVQESTAQFGAAIKDEIARYGKAVASTRIK